MVRAQAKPKDEIVLLRGCGVPVILREVQHGKYNIVYNIVGAAYLHPIPSIEHFVVTAGKST